MIRFTIFFAITVIKFGETCLPSGGLLGGLGSPSCGCSTCPCSSQSYIAPQQPVYSYSYPQPSYRPPPVAIPPSPLVSHSSYQGQYLDMTMNNPAYHGKAPLGFPGESMPTPVISASRDQSPQIVDPLQYIEHVSVSHTPPEYPKEPFGKLTIHQIQVAPSSAATEDEYTVSSENASNSTEKAMVTYYNQICAGQKIATGEKETINSATKKCEMLKCVAANAQSDSFGTYTVTFLKTAVSRTNKKGVYCLSSMELPVKSKRVIRRYDDMIANAQAERVRRLLQRRRI